MKEEGVAEEVRGMVTYELLRNISKDEGDENGLLINMAYAEALERGGATASTARRKYENNRHSSISQDRLRELRNLVGTRTSRSEWRRMAVEVSGMSNEELLSEIAGEEGRQVPMAYAEALQRGEEVASSAEKVYDLRSTRGEIPVLLERERETLLTIAEEVGERKKMGPIAGAFYNMILFLVASFIFYYFYVEKDMLHMFLYESNSIPFYMSITYAVALCIPFFFLVVGDLWKQTVLRGIRTIIRGPLGGAEIESLDRASLPDRK